MKKISSIALTVLTVVLLVGCASIVPSDAGYVYMSGITPAGDNGVWKAKSYVDEFRNPTDKRYIVTQSVGTFSNSATNGSKLYAEIIVNRNSVEINLLEYGSYPISVIGSDSSIDVRINVNGETIELGRAWFSESTKRLTIYNTLPLFKALVENPEITMLVTINDYGLSKYLFDINSAGFEYTYHEAFLK